MTKSVKAGAGSSPAPPARCLALLNRLSRYIDNELTPGQRRAIQTHCHDCARCRRMPSRRTSR